MKKALLLGSCLALIAGVAHAETTDIMNPFYQVKQGKVKSTTSYKYSRYKLKADEDDKAFLKTRELSENINVGILDQLSLDLEASRIRERGEFYGFDDGSYTKETESERYHNLGFGLTGKIIDNDQFKLQGSVSFLSKDDNQERYMNYSLKFGYSLNENTDLFVKGSFTDGKDRDTKSDDPNTDLRYYDAQVGAYTKLNDFGLTLDLGYRREHSLYHNKYEGNDNLKYYYVEGQAAYQFNDKVYVSLDGKYSFHEKFSTKSVTDNVGDYVEGSKLKRISKVETTLSLNVLF
ncbi:MAG: hypothetical protein MJ247_02645 [Alphaproteobacteria bacterium]|nr:hypothetical protein [Alphaproteobacteria bacterium]